MSIVYCLLFAFLILRQKEATSMRCIICANYYNYTFHTTLKHIT